MICFHHLLAFAALVSGLSVPQTNYKYRREADQGDGLTRRGGWSMAGAFCNLPHYVCFPLPKNKPKKPATAAEKGKQPAAEPPAPPADEASTSGSDSEPDLPVVAGGFRQRSEIPIPGRGVTAYGDFTEVQNGEHPVKGGLMWTFSASRIRDNGYQLVIRVIPNGIALQKGWKFSETRVQFRDDRKTTWRVTGNENPLTGRVIIAKGDVEAAEKVKSMENFVEVSVLAIPPPAKPKPPPKTRPKRPWKRPGKPPP